ncbi:hypothetical protein PspTeo4_20272 [Pseudomonas sp. Teo4]|nr:hypothetical protein [Pseudomonas sp. Teo4]
MALSEMAIRHVRVTGKDGVAGHLSILSLHGVQGGRVFELLRPDQITPKHPVT